MRVTVIPEDKFISVDGEGLFFNFTIPDGLPNCHAIQWNDNSGHMEISETMENVSVDYEKDVKPYVELWKAEKERVDSIINRPPTIEELKASKLAEINSEYEVATSALVSTYPDTELLTFEKQEAEARAWKADNSASTPFLDSLARARGIDKAELVERVIIKAEAFQTAVATLTGLRQKYEDQLVLALTAEDVAAIKPNYNSGEMSTTGILKLSPYYDL